MQDYKKLVDALRCCASGFCDSERCDYMRMGAYGCMIGLAQDAADAIEALQAEVYALKHDIKRHVGINAELTTDNEALQAEVGRLEMRCADCEYGNSPWPEEPVHEPKHGEWIEENRRPRSSQFVCSVCHRTAYDPQPTRDKAWKKRCRYSYCPNCGAKMEVQDGKEN